MAGMGAEAILTILKELDLEALRDKLQKDIRSTSGQRRKKAIKTLRVAEALRKSGNKPEWMILSTLPVLPPELRPMVQLDGGRRAGGRDGGGIDCEPDASGGVDQPESLGLLDNGDVGGSRGVECAGKTPAGSVQDVLHLAL